MKRLAVLVLLVGLTTPSWAMTEQEKWNAQFSKALPTFASFLAAGGGAKLSKYLCKAVLPGNPLDGFPGVLELADPPTTILCTVYSFGANGNGNSASGFANWLPVAR